MGFLKKHYEFEVEASNSLGMKQHCDGECNFLKKEASKEAIAFFNDIVPQMEHLYLLVVAMTAGEYWGSNRNGDYFLNDDLKKYYKIFETHGNVFWNHNNKDPKNKAGKVVKAFWNDKMHRIEIVLDIPFENTRHLLGDIQNKTPIKVSMGLNTPSERCSICGHVTRGSYNNRCIHLKSMMHKVLSDGRKVYAICGTPYKIYDISIISGRQADKTAFAMLTKTKKGSL